MVAVISVGAYHFLAFSDVASLLEGTGIGLFLVTLWRQILWRPNLEVATKRLLHQQVKVSVFDSVSFNIDEALSINPFVVFVFGDFNVHHEGWVTYSGKTDRPAEVCYNFSSSNDLTEMVKFPTRISDCGSHRPALLDLFTFSDASICSTMAFPSLGNSDHVVVSCY